MRISLLIAAAALLPGCATPDTSSSHTSRGFDAVSGRETFPPYVRGGYPGNTRTCETRNSAGEPVVYSC